MCFNAIFRLLFRDLGLNLPNPERKTEMCAIDGFLLENRKNKLKQTKIITIWNWDAETVQFQFKETVSRDFRPCFFHFFAA
jgi:hypothetical protein